MGTGYSAMYGMTLNDDDDYQLNLYTNKTKLLIKTVHEQNETIYDCD